MDIQIERKQSWTCVAVTERLDAVSAPTLEKSGLEVLAENSQIALDFKDLSYVSSAGLRVILLLGKKAKAGGGKLVICGPVGMVKEIIEESGLDAFFNIYSSVEDLD